MARAGWAWLAFSFGISAIILAWIFLPDHIKGLASESWHRTDGVIVKSDLRYFTEPKTKEFYRYHVTFKYEVNGQAFEADEIQFPEPKRYPPEDKVREALRAAYPVGKKVDVFYNPALPGEACLQPGMDRTMAGALAVMMAACVGVTLFCLFKLIRKRPSGREDGIESGLP